MIKTLRIALEYGCYPVWLYDEKSNIVDNLQMRYDALFTNHAIEFDYIGFKTEAEKNEFFDDWKSAISNLSIKAKNKYEIIDEITI